MESSSAKCPVSTVACIAAIRVFRNLHHPGPLTCGGRTAGPGDGSGLVAGSLRTDPRVFYGRKLTADRVVVSIGAEIVKGSRRLVMRIPRSDRRFAFACCYRTVVGARA